MSTYSDFLDYVMPDVPGCTTQLAEHEIRNACIEFCEKTLILQVDHDPITIVAGIVDYDLDPPKNTLVTKVMKAWYNSQELTMAAPDDINKAEVYNRLFSGADTGRNDPRYILQKDERRVSVFPIPQSKSANGLTLRVALKPSRASTTVDSLIFEDYAEVIGSGAKARLMMSPGKPWSEANLAAAEMSLFKQGINDARSRAVRGHMRSDISVKLRRI
jgi:hypothetical protein